MEGEARKLNNVAPIPRETELDPRTGISGERGGRRGGGLPDNDSRLSKFMPTFFQFSFERKRERERKEEEEEENLIPPRFRIVYFRLETFRISSFFLINYTILFERETMYL